MSETTKVAGVQMTPVLADSAGNLARCLELMRTAAAQGAQLIVFPEAALSGYVYGSLEEALPVAEPVPGPSTDRIADSCRELNVHVVIGMLEKDGNKCYNAAVFVGPAGLIGKHRKLHLPYVGVDRFVDRGDLPLRVYDTDLGRIGLSVCYDLDFPEQSRVLALLGADMIIAISNWPEGIEFVPEYLVHARARENMLYLLAVNRVGEERGVRFIGRSKFVDHMGMTLAEGPPYDEDIIYATLDPAAAREKHKVIIPGELEIDMLKDRRPEFYGLLAQ
jgi:5-aminopentanamidase